MRVRYLHSDIETVERVEIIRDLRLGKFDVLVGINLLREGLDMPEVSLVAILDADKEGFLRSAGSLIQTIGRAARNLRGKAILYADRDDQIDAARRSTKPTAAARSRSSTTSSTASRRSRSSSKIIDIMEGARADAGDRADGPRHGLRQRRRSRREDYAALAPAQVVGEDQGSSKRRCTSTRRTWSSRTPRACATRSAGCKDAMLAV